VAHRFLLPGPAAGVECRVAWSIGVVGHHLPGLTVPNPDFPVVGDNVPIALLFLAHMAIVQFGLGAITLAPIYEILAFRQGDPNKLRFAHALAKAYYLTFSLGATLGVFAVTALIGLWGFDVGILVNRFLPLVGLAFGLFPVLVPMIVIYYNTFGKMQPGRHAALGVTICLVQTLFMVLIVGMDAYMITPHNTGLLSAVGNAAYVPLLLHRLIGNVSWAALFIAAVAVIRLAQSKDEGDAAYHSWAARQSLRIGIATLVLMPVAGVALIYAIKNDVPGFFDNMFRGSTAWLFVIQAVALLVVFVGANVALLLETSTDVAGADARGRVLTLATLVGLVVGSLPSSVLGESIYGVRYIGIAVAILATLLHLVLRTIAPRQRLALKPAPGAQVVLPFAASRARLAVVVTGCMAVFLTLWMGTIKEVSRGDYAVYGELTQNDAHGTYNPSGIYP
jgi:hypothetical protein